RISKRMAPYLASAAVAGDHPDAPRPRHGELVDREGLRQNVVENRRVPVGEVDDDDALAGQAESGCADRRAGASGAVEAVDDALPVDLGSAGHLIEDDAA